MRRSTVPGLGFSLAAVAAGAILAFAVSASTPGVSLPAVGVILMVVGVVGFATALYLDQRNREAATPTYEPPPPAYERRDYPTAYDDPQRTRTYRDG